MQPLLGGKPLLARIRLCLQVVHRGLLRCAVVL